MEVITLLLLMGAGLVECQTKTTEVDQAYQKIVFILVVGVLLLLVVTILLHVLNLIEARKHKDKPAKCQDNEVDKTQEEALTSKLTSFTHSLQNMPENMRSFSQSMRALYAEMALGTTSETAKKLNVIRNDTRRDAQVYVQGILPVSSTVIRSIKEFFDIYESFDFDEWREYLPSMVDDVGGYRQCCETLVTLHMEIMVPLKHRQDEARILISELTDLTEKLDTKTKELQDSAKDNHVWTALLLTIPGLNFFALPLKVLLAIRNRIEVVAGAQQSKINKSAINVLSETMMPAISSFIDGLNAAAGFFKLVEYDIASFEEATKMTMRLKQQLHYKLMKKQAAEVKASCREFYCMIPEVESDFKAIPEMPDDRNYVERWLEKQQKQIKEKYSAKITDPLKIILDYLTLTAADDLTIEK